MSQLYDQFRASDGFLYIRQGKRRSDLFPFKLIQEPSCRIFVLDNCLNQCSTVVCYNIYIYIWILAIGVGSSSDPVPVQGISKLRPKGQRHEPEMDQGTRGHCFEDPLVP